MCEKENVLGNDLTAKVILISTQFYKMFQEKGQIERKLVCAETQQEYGLPVDVLRSLVF